MSNSTLYHELCEALLEHGLRPRGGFALSDEDLANLPGAQAGGYLLLVGNLGGSLWRAFSQSAEAHDGLPHPMDRWSERVLSDLAERFGARAFFPFGGPPYHPFQRWAKRAESLSSSPLGLLIHPTAGLWHAYRGALLFQDLSGAPEAQAVVEPCLSCEDKPCLSSCPVSAFTEGVYDVESCRDFLGSEAGEDCMTKGCAARLACPYAKNYLYGQDQMQFHMHHFLAARKAG